MQPSPRISPHYAWTLTVTDVALGWTEVRALKNKAQKWTLEAADDIAAAFPVPPRGLDSDGGGEFIKRGTFALSGSVEEQPAFQGPV